MNVRSFPDLRQKVVAFFSGPVDVALRYRVAVKFLLHMAIFIIANYLAYLIRFDFHVPDPYRSVVIGTIPVLLVTKALGFLSFGLFHGWWRYVSIKDVLPIVGGCTLGSALFAGTVYFMWGPYHVPRSIYLLDWGTTLVIVLGARR